MTPFTDLAESPALPESPDGSLAARQGALDALFPAAVAHSPLRLWAPGDPVPARGDRLLIGIATWSGRDMALLDAVSQSLRDRHPPVTIEVFNVAGCASPDVFDRYVPGIGAVYHTPVVGLWSEGRLVDKASGKAGHDLIARVVGLPRSHNGD
jgi:hypothetical protein